MIDRSLFGSLLNKEQIPPRLRNSESAARWLGSQVGATVVLIGQATMVRDDIVQLSARFLNVDDENLIGPSSEVNLQAKVSEADLHPIKDMRDLLSYGLLPDTVSGEKVYRAGVNGVGLPSCYYMPNPPYTEEARKAKFSGTVIAEAVVGSDGTIRGIRIVDGVLHSLNAQVIKTMKTWKCKPATLDGRPVATVLPFEVNFRLY